MITILYTMDYKYKYYKYKMKYLNLIGGENINLKVKIIGIAGIVSPPFKPVSIDTMSSFKDLISTYNDKIIKNLGTEYNIVIFDKLTQTSIAYDYTTQIKDMNIVDNSEVILQYIKIVKPIDIGIKILENLLKFLEEKTIKQQTEKQQVIISEMSFNTTLDSYEKNVIQQLQYKNIDYDKNDITIVLYDMAFFMDEKKYVQFYDFLNVHEEDVEPEIRHELVIPPNKIRKYVKNKDDILKRVVENITHKNKANALLHVGEVFRKIRERLDNKKITFYVINLEITNYEEYKKMMKKYETNFNIYNFDGSKSNFDM